MLSVEPLVLDPRGEARSKYVLEAAMPLIHSSCVNYRRSQSGVPHGLTLFGKRYHWLLCGFRVHMFWPKVLPLPPSPHNRKDESTVRPPFRTGAFARGIKVEICLFLDLTVLFGTKGGEC